MHKSTKFLIFENIIIIFIGLLFIPISMGHNIPLPLPYLWHKWLHGDTVSCGVCASRSKSCCVCITVIDVEYV